jgi:hypothetical protein
LRGLRGTEKKLMSERPAGFFRFFSRSSVVTPSSDPSSDMT